MRRAWTAAKLLEPFDISPAQAGLLYQVGRGERVPSQIARQMLVDPSNLSRQIRVLEARGLLTREVDDANRTRAILRLTEAGRSMARRIDPHAAIIEGAIARRLGPSGAAALRRALEQVRLALDAAASQSIPIDDD